ncbi:MAG TPA: maleylpyruvate isomerase family mycothiol-dependent enzyme [Streptosporangiaceae bacterium]|nr:maleylpyruvate isomerase family mycothiol-dependent enzyme [Streptosporangiaceae bacterium]
MPDSLVAPGEPVRHVSPVAPGKPDDPGESAALDDRIDPDDPAGTARRLRARVAAASALLLISAEQISDQQAREPSLLPGWSRGHLLTHLARNADSLRNLLTWARTGVTTPQYSSPDERSEGIERGAGRPAAELLADLEESAAALDAAAASLPAEAWAAHVAWHAAWYTLWRRLTEVEIHHVDLGLGYSPADWPVAFATYSLEQYADFADARFPAVELRSSDTPVVVRIGPPADQPTTKVTGPVRNLLAWLTGRSLGTGLSAEPAGPLPALPSF